MDYWPGFPFRLSFFLARVHTAGGRDSLFHLSFLPFFGHKGESNLLCGRGKENRFPRPLIIDADQDLLSTKSQSRLKFQELLCYLFFTSWKKGGILRVDGGAAAVEGGRGSVAAAASCGPGPSFRRPWPAPGAGPRLAGGWQACPCGSAPRPGPPS